MNELMEFFSTYRIDWMQASLLALGVAGASGLVIKKVISKKKKHWSDESSYSENQAIVPFSVPHATNYDSMVTEEVNNFLMPKVAIDDPKEEERSEESFKLDKPSVQTAVDVSPEYHPPVTDFVAPDVTEYEQEAQMIDVPPVEEIKASNSKEFNFLDSFDESAKLPEIMPMPYVLTRPSAEENQNNDYPTLTQEDTAPKSPEKTLDPSFNLELPSLTNLYPPAAPKIEKAPEVLTIPIESPVEVLPEIKQEAHDNIPLLTEELPVIASPVVESNEIAFVLEPMPEVIDPVLPPVEVIEEPVVNTVEAPIISVLPTKPQFYTGIPTLTEVFEPPVNVKTNEPEIVPFIIEEPVKVEEKFVPTVKPEIDEEKFEFTKKYHVVIEEALYFDSQNNKEEAMNKLIEAGKLIENIRVNFYLKIAMQSYKNAVTTNALPSIINQFYIIEKEKLMKEDAQKKQEADVASMKSQKLSPIQAIKETNKVSLEEEKETVMSHPASTAVEAQSGDNLPKQVLDTVNEPAVEIPVAPVDLAVEVAPPSPWEQGYVLFTSPEGELVAAKPEAPTETTPEFMMPLSRQSSPWKGGAVVVGQDGNLMPYEPTLVESHVQAVEHAVEDVTAIVEESNPPLPEVNEPTIEEVQIKSVEDTSPQAEDIVVTQFEELPASESVDSESLVGESHALQLHQEPVSLVENITEPVVEVPNVQEDAANTEVTPLLEEAFNNEPVLPEGVEAISFEEAFVTSPEVVQEEVKAEVHDLEVFVAEVESAPLEEVALEPVVLTVEENEPPVEFAPFEDPVEHNASEGLLSDPELSPVAETIQQEIENTDIQDPALDNIVVSDSKLDSSQFMENLDFQDTKPSENLNDLTTEQDSPNAPVDNEVQAANNFARVVSSLEQTSAWFEQRNKLEIAEDSPVPVNPVEPVETPIEQKLSIEDEFSDEETKNQFMGAFGDMFKPKSVSETPNIVIPQKRKHSVWVNWMSTEGGKMNFKNDMIELSAAWGTKTAIEDLHQQLQALVGEGNQFSVVSVFEAK